MTRWLITGGCGFIGSNLLRRLTTEGGHDLRVLDNLEVGRRARLAALAPVIERPAAACGDRGSAGRIELVVGDIMDPAAVAQAARGRDVIVHLAANTGVAPSVDNPRRDCLINVVGTLNCLEAARLTGARRFVLASSGAAYGASEPPIHEGRAARPVSPYGASKLAGEGYCSAYWSTFGVEAVALRFGNVYGPGSDHKSSVVATFIKRALAGQALEIYGDGGQTRDFVYIDDLVDAIVRAASAPDVGGEVLQIASARETTVTEITALLVRSLVEAGLAEPVVRHTDPRAGDAPRLYADTSKALRLLGWRPAIPLEEGVRRVVRWFLASRPSPVEAIGVGATTPAAAAGG